MPRGLAPKLILSITAIVAVVEGAFGFVNARIQERQLLHEVVLSADELSNTITSATWHSMLADHRESAYEVMRTIGQQEEVRRVRFFNKQGRITFSTGGDTGRLIDKSAEACYLCHKEGEPLVRVNAPSRVRTFEENGHRLLGMVTPIYNEPACTNAACHVHPKEQKVLGVLDISVPLDRLDAEVTGIRFRSLLTALVSVVLIGTCVIFFTRKLVSRPVQRLIEATKKVAEMDLERPVEVNSRDEIGELGHSFNVMRERLLEAQARIEDFTRNLERKVEERTKQLRETQEQLVRSEKLASLGRLAASVAHEVNNPLSGVLNFAKLMERLLTPEGIPPDRIEDFRRYLHEISEETARAGAIVSDLLAFSRRSRDGSVPSDLNEIIRRTVSVLSPRLAEAEITCDLDLDPCLPRTSCDPSRIQQVITNLVMNGAEASSPGGRITIRTRPADTREPAVELVVADEGEGIPEENLSQIYDPFFTTRQEGKGTGLGLAVVYGIVESHGGSIHVESRVGEGTRFTVILPCSPGPGASPGGGAEDGEEG